MAVISFVFSGTLNCAKISLAWVASARRFAVDGDEFVPVRPERGNPAVETAAKQGWIDPIDEMPEPALAWNAVMKLREMPQEGEMVFAPGDDVVEIVAGGDRGDACTRPLDKSHAEFPRF
jgi:hypothetical protein